VDLEEDIGNVSTGPSEQAILANLRRRKYEPIALGSPANNESCCICQVRAILIFSLPVGR
jgi:hypothetical protein